MKNGFFLVLCVGFVSYSVSSFALEYEKCSADAAYCFGPNDKDNKKITAIKSEGDLKKYYQYKQGQLLASAEALSETLRDHRDEQPVSPGYSQWIQSLGSCLPQYNFHEKKWTGNTGSFGSNGGNNSFDACLANIPNLPEDVKKSARMLNYQAAAVRHSADLCAQLKGNWCKNHNQRSLGDLKVGVSHLYVSFAQPTRRHGSVAKPQLMATDQLKKITLPKGNYLASSTQGSFSAIKGISKGLSDESLQKAFEEYRIKIHYTEYFKDVIYNKALFETGNKILRNNGVHLESILKTVKKEYGKIESSASELTKKAAGSPGSAVQPESSAESESALQHQ